MIRLQDIRKKLSDIKEQVELKVLHPYLLNFIQTPYIDEDKLLIFISLMDRLGLSYSQMKNYALSAMLIQIALDTHEYVTNEVINNDEKAKATSRQLTVLAGDYYSGLYYKLLADTDDISMIKVLAQGIKEVNEHKIFLYQKDFDGIEKLMKSIKIIESSLLTKVSEYFQAGVWTEVIGHLMLVKRLLGEKKRFIHAESSQLFEALKNIIFPKNDTKLKELSKEQKRYLLVICDRYIQFSKNFVANGLEQIPYLNDVLEERIRTILNQHLPIANTFVEEG